MSVIKTPSVVVGGKPINKMEFYDQDLKYNQTSNLEKVIITGTGLYVLYLVVVELVLLVIK